MDHRLSIDKKSIDYLCLKFAESKVNPLKIYLEKLSVGRLTAFFGSECELEDCNCTPEQQLFRILRRCSKVDTLHLKMPTGSSFDYETIGIMRLLVRNVPVRLAKVTRLVKFDPFARLVPVIF